MLAEVSLPTLPPLYAHKRQLDPEHLGLLKDSSHLLDDPEAMRQRMEQEGYLFLPGCLDRDEVLDARREMLRRLAASGYLAEGTDPMLAMSSGKSRGVQPQLAKDNEPLKKVIHHGKMIEIFRRFLGGEVLHFDYTWIRAIAPGMGTRSHCDSVYMNRGTLQLYTAWTPMGDVPWEQGGLMILEGSNNNQRLRETYCSRDVDTYCENRASSFGPDGKPLASKSGWLTENAVQLRKSLGGRWLTSEYRAGDVLIFSIFTVHASLDNRSDRIRLSTDTRYQLASEKVDERWIGESPSAHGARSKRWKIC